MRRRSLDSIELASLKERRKKEKSIFDCLSFSMYMDDWESAATCTGSIPHVGYVMTDRRLESVRRLIL